MPVDWYKPHVCIIPEDDANRQLVQGFLNHLDVRDVQVEVHDPAGGWLHVLKVFRDEYLAHLTDYDGAHVVLLLDFDEKDGRRAKCEEELAIPEEFRERVFLIGCWSTPEKLRKELGKKLPAIGNAAADNCLKEQGFWTDGLLAHNAAEVSRMTPVLKPILFGR